VYNYLSIYHHYRHEQLKFTSIMISSSLSRSCSWSCRISSHLLA